MKIIKGETPYGQRVEISTMPDSPTVADNFIQLCGEISETMFTGVFVDEGYIPVSYNGICKIGNLTCAFKIFRDK